MQSIAFLFQPRAQNDADSRRWKSEVKKLQHTLEMAKKSNGIKKAIESGPESSGAHVTADGLINYEIQRLTNEIAVLKEANRNKEEKTQVSGRHINTIIRLTLHAACDS